MSKTSPEQVPASEERELEHLFVEDIRSRMASIADCIFRLEEQIERHVPVDYELVARLMREYHTVKACADFDGISTLAHVAHNVEDLLELFLKEHIPPERTHLDLLYTVIDFTLQIIGDIDIPEEDLQHDADELIRTINIRLGELTELIEKRMVEGEDQGAFLSHHQDDMDRLSGGIALDQEKRKAKEALDELKGLLLRVESGDGVLGTQAARGVALLDVVLGLKSVTLPPGLLRLMQELKETLAAAARRKTRPEGCDFGILSDVLVVVRNCCAALFTGGKVSVAGFDALIELISDIRWQLRMNIPQTAVFVPDVSESCVALKTVAGNARKLVMKASRELKKEIQFVEEVEDLEIAKSVVGKLNVVLAHLIRNAMDHGIESAEERGLAGKESRGTLRFSARLSGNELCVLVQDDGRGLQREKILRKARERGIIGENEVDVDVVSLIMSPGFSTADMPTMYSGRGMGMGIVLGTVTELGGRLEVESEPGKGAAYRMLLPAKAVICRAVSHEDA